MNKGSRVIPVILCGGSGTRLWPLSRKNFPKPFLKVGSESLIAHTVRRAAAVANATLSEDVLLVSNESHQFLLQDECWPVLNSESGGAIALHQLLEPQGRNTAPAIALAAQWAQARYPNETLVLLVLPADHLIHPVGEFVRVALRAVAAARKGWLCCFGIAPTAPETGFGYIQQGIPVDEINGVFAVEQFIEKPALAAAVQYLASGQCVWNGGMFALCVHDWLGALEKHAPVVAAQAQVVWAGAVHADGQKKGSVTAFNANEFAKLPDVSIDYAVMEKARNVAVVSASFEWSDIGSWAALAQQCTADERGNTVQQAGQGQWIGVDTRNTHVRAESRAVATLGVENLLIVDTPDALLVADQSRHQDVKKVVDVLKLQGSNLVNIHPTVHRPWGTYTVLENAGGYKIKRIEVKPGAALSLQMHRHRSEHWIVVSGTAEVTNGEQVFLVQKNESTYIPAGNKHRLVNPGSITLIMIEVQSGDYLEEDDIVRFEDVYGRV